MSRFLTAIIGAMAMALILSAAFLAAPAVAQGDADLYDRPTLAVDPGMHTAVINALAADPAGRYLVTGGADRTVRIWSAADGGLIRTIWIPFGPDPVGDIMAVAISPDGSTVAAGGYTERFPGPVAIYLFDRESGTLIQRIHGDLSEFVGDLAFSPDGRYLAATLHGKGGLRVFDREKDWSLAFRDSYGDTSYGVAFAPDGRLATVSFEANGAIRLYDADFRLIAGPVNTPGGKEPFHVAFSPDGRLVAVGYLFVAAVDLFDGRSLERQPPPPSTGLLPGPGGLGNVAWSSDGGTLFAGGSTGAWGVPFLVAWDQAGRGPSRTASFCGSNTISGIAPLPDRRVVVSSQQPCLGASDPKGAPLWTAPSPLASFRFQINSFKVSANGDVVDFDFGDANFTPLRFDVRSLRLTQGASVDGRTFPASREGLAIEGWLSGLRPTLGGRPILLEKDDISRSLAIAPDGKRFFLGSQFALAAYDEAGAVRWRRPSRSEVWLVNATRDGRILVAAEGDGTIRWHRADDGRELLALQVLPNKTDWVLWTPEGFYEATPGARDALKWVVNHGPERAASTLPVSAIPRLHRPDALLLVLQELETARALGIADVAAARLAVQTATGSAKPPGGRLHVLAVGIDRFGGKAGGLHLDYAAEDARDVANALLESQKGGPGKPSLYADVSVQFLPNDQASRAAVLDALDAMDEAMRKSGADQDVAVILVSSHGEMIDDQFYLIPYDFDASSKNAATGSAVSASALARKIASIARGGRVLLLLDACHSGAVGAGGWATDPDAKVLQDAMDMENVTVLTSSKKNELSQELSVWRHGALAQAFLDALSGAADPQGHGIIRLSALTDAMDAELQSLTKGRQHLGLHVNFGGDLFLVSHRD